MNVCERDCAPPGSAFDSEKTFFLIIIYKRISIYLSIPSYQYIYILLVSSSIGQFLPFYVQISQFKLPFQCNYIKIRLKYERIGCNILNLFTYSEFNAYDCTVALINEFPILWNQRMNNEYPVTFKKKQKRLSIGLRYDPVGLYKFLFYLFTWYVCT